MNWISNLFSRYGRNVHLITIAILSVVLTYGGYTIGDRHGDAPASLDDRQSLTDDPPPFNVNRLLADGLITVFYYPFHRIENSVADLIRVQEENREYHEALVEVSVRLSMLEEARLENDRLRDILGFDPPPTYTLLPAEVVSITGEIVPVSATINRGAEDSVFVNQPIINQDGLIGRVSTVMPHYATIQLLTDPANRVASRLVTSRDMGIAKYVVGEGLILDNFPVQAEVREGDRVVSSGLGGVYPAGLKVGAVRSVFREEEAVFTTVHLDPAVDFLRLDELFILRQGRQ